MSSVHHLKQLIDRYHLANRHEDIATYQQMIELDMMSEPLAKNLVRTMQPLVEAQKRCPNLLPAPPTADDLGSFDLEFGDAIERSGIRAGFNVSDRPRHVIASGSTGFGKTIFLRSLLTSLPRDICVIIIDTKSVFSDIKHLMGKDRCDYYNIFEGFKVGLNAPSDLPGDVWVNLMAKVLAAHSGFVMAEGSLTQLINIARAELSPTGSEWPSIHLLYEILCNTPLEALSAKADYGKTLIQALRILIQETPHAIDTFSGFDAIKHVIDTGRSCVIDLTNCPDRTRSIIVDTLILQLLAYRQYFHQKRDCTDVLLVIDEADAFVSRDACNLFAPSLSPLALLLKQGREFGIMAAIGVSFLGQVVQMIRSNISCHFAFTQPDNQSLIEAARTLMVPKGGEGIFASLQPGECVFRQADGRFPYPFLVKIDYVPPARGARPSSFDTHPFTPSKSLGQLPKLQARLDDLVGRWKNQKKTVAAKKGLSKEATALLKAAAGNWWIPDHYLWPRTGLHPSQDRKVRVHKELIAVGCATLYKCRFGSAYINFVELTDKGWQAIQQTKQPRPGRGNLPHSAVSHWIALTGQHQGYKTQMEWKVPGTNHPVDVAWHTPDGNHAFEVCMSAKNIISHINACFIASTDVSKLTIVMEQKRQIDPIRKDVERQGRFAAFIDRINYEPVASFMSEEVFQ